MPQIKVLSSARQVVFDGDADSIEIDGCQFNLRGIERLAHSKGELFCACREDYYVVVHSVSVDLGSGYGRLVVRTIEELKRDEEKACQPTKESVVEQVD